MATVSEFAGSVPMRRFSCAPAGKHTAPAGNDSGRGGAVRNRGPRSAQGVREGQAKFASVSFHVADGRMTAAALAGSGW